MMRTPLVNGRPVDGGGLPDAPAGPQINREETFSRGQRSCRRNKEASSEQRGQKHAGY